MPQIALTDSANTVFSVQSLGSAESILSISYHDVDGTLIHTQETTLPPNGWVRYNLRQMAQLGDSFEGSAVIEATGPVRAWVDEYPDEPQYILDVTTVGEGDVDVDPDQDTYHYGHVVTLTATADPGWTFVGWSGDVESTDNPLELTIQTDTDLIATFTQEEYTLEVAIVGEGDVAIFPQQDTYIYGDVVTLYATAWTGWTFRNWSGGVFSTEGRLHLTMDSHKTLTATFQLKTYVITPTVGAGGVITPSTPQTVQHGDDITFTIAANPGYHVADVVVDGISQGAISSYTFINVASNHAISATFELSVPPQFVSADHTAFFVRAAETFTVEATGIPTPTIALTGVLPSGVTFTDKGDGTAILSGTPAASSAGVYPLFFTASNNVTQDAMQAFTLTVKTRVYLPLVLADH